VILHGKPQQLKLLYTDEPAQPDALGIKKQSQLMKSNRVINMTITPKELNYFSRNH
jgi:hypothetical protein